MNEHRGSPKVRFSAPRPFSAEGYFFQEFRGRTAIHLRIAVKGPGRNMFSVATPSTHQPGQILANQCSSYALGCRLGVELSGKLSSIQLLPSLFCLFVGTLDIARRGSLLADRLEHLLCVACSLRDGQANAKSRDRWAGGRRAGGRSMSCGRSGGWWGGRGGRTARPPGGRALVESAEPWEPQLRQRLEQELAATLAQTR